MERAIWLLTAAAVKRKTPEDERDCRVELNMKTQAHALFSNPFKMIVFISIILLDCVPKQLQIQPVIKTVPEPDSLMLSDPDMFEKEITRLKMMVRLKDTSMTKEQALTQLFNLYIHLNNPEPQYDKAVFIADTLSRIAHKQKRQQYRNWKYILEQYLQSAAVKDSLEKVIDKMSEDIKSLRYTARKQSKQIDSLSILINDSLSTTITKQKKTIEKLQELDLKLEQQRSKIQ